MATHLSLSTSLNRLYINSSQFEEDPIYALLELQPVVEAATSQRSPLNIVIVIDSSGTMYNFQLNETERDYWMGLALSRDEMERGEADAQEAVFWSGQTLLDMQSIVRKPITLAVDAIKELLHSLQFGDKVAVIAFADTPLTIFGADDWTRNSEECFGRLDALISQQLSVDIGTGTKLAQPMTNAFDLIRQSGGGVAVDRIIVISDGIVQDEDATNAVVETIKTGGMAVSTIGIGDDFDEEFLMNVADVTRGGYHYAADSQTITSELISELVVIKSTAVRQLHIAAQGIAGTVVQDIYLAKPNMTIFDEIESSNGWISARVGDLPSDLETALLIQLAPSKQDSGRHDIVTIELSWQSSDGVSSLPAQNQQTETIVADYTSDPYELSQTNPPVQELVDRFKVYKFEREAQRAQEVGDTDKAKEKLGAATRQLRNLGENNLADDLEAQIANISAGTDDPTRVKRIKATTRKLGSSTAVPDIETP
jgi:Ca-activated chloride channel family protein